MKTGKRSGKRKRKDKTKTDKEGGRRTQWNKRNEKIKIKIISIKMKEKKYISPLNKSSSLVNNQTSSSAIKLSCLIINYY